MVVITQTDWAGVHLDAESRRGRRHRDEDRGAAVWALLIYLVFLVLLGVPRFKVGEPRLLLNIGVGDAFVQSPWLVGSFLDLLFERVEQGVNVG